MTVYLGSDILANSVTSPYNWSGTKAQYEALETIHPDWIYYVTDDSDTPIELLKTIYPVGVLYLTTAATCPLSALFGTWELVGSDKVLQGAGTRGTVGTTVNESLPDPSIASVGPHSHTGTTGTESANHTHSRGDMNITGNFATWDLGGYEGAAGAFSSSKPSSATGADSGTGGYDYRVYFDASRNWTGATSNQSANHTHDFTTSSTGGHTHTIQSSVYQSNAPVQQDAYLINIFRRTA